jgi:predicted PhzF superfamily epimerase YddE/YHI9
MRLPLYQIDAFSARVFGGNPAAVVPLDSWLPDATMQAIAAENNLAETAFFVKRADDWQLRWFTPAVEVDLCGHATLASAHLIFSRLEPDRGEARFATRSGELVVARDGDWLVMDFPSWPPKPCPATPAIAEALGKAPREVAGARDYLCVFDSEADIRALKPDMAKLARLDRFAVCVTAPGADGAVDFVSRFFAPAQGVPEDSVTGSAHCMLIPYWAGRLGKNKLVARQISQRGGELRCELRGDRVTIAGRAVLYLEGHIEV